MKKHVKGYIRVMLDIFNEKYKVNKFKARIWILLFGFNRAMKECDYLILHDDAEDWVDVIYGWANNE